MGFDVSGDGEMCEQFPSYFLFAVYIFPVGGEELCL
jgi:hypothetical protein